MTLWEVRIAALVIAAAGAGVALRYRRTVADAVRLYFTEPGSALAPAIFRIFLFGFLFSQTSRGMASWYASLPGELLSLPPGWGWTRGFLSLDVPTVEVAETVMQVSCLFAVFGILTRFSVATSVVLAVYLLGIPNFYLKINHGNHALVLCALILAFSPCGDALSVDRLWRRLRGIAAPGLSRAYSVPMRMSWLILGTVYLFPGLWKLFQGGDQWVSGHKLLFELHHKWAMRPGFEPLFRIDQYPSLLAMLGIATVIFEIGFIFALFHRGTRVVAAFSAVGFHVGVANFIGIRFSPYPPLALLLDFPMLPAAIAGLLPLPFRAVLERVVESVRPVAERGGRLLDRVSARLPGAEPRSMRSERPMPHRAHRPALVVGSVFTAMMFVAGLVPIDSWPVGIYPRFSNRSGKPITRASTTQFMVRSADAEQGEERPLGGRLSRLGKSRLKRLLSRPEKLQSKPAELAAYTKMLVQLLRDHGAQLRPSDELRLYRESWDIFPLGERRATRRQLMSVMVVNEDLTLTIREVAKPRNVVLISIDTLRADHLEAYGYERLTAPAVARLAAEGVVFEQALSQSPFTAPSHMTMFTGLHPLAHGVRNWSAEGSRLSDDIPTLAEALASAGIRTVAFAGGGNVDAGLGFDRGFETFEEHIRGAISEGRRFLDDLAADGRPFFLFLHTKVVHDPYLPKDEYARLFTDSDYAGKVGIRPEQLAEIRKNKDWSAQYRAFWDGLNPDDPADVQHLRDLYDGLIRQMDAQLAQLLDALEGRGMLDDTLVVFTADHGEEFHEHGGFRHMTLHREILHVPLVMRFPKIDRARARLRGRRIAPAVRLVDLMPTLLDWLGVPPPGPQQGRSLLPLIDGDEQESRPVFSASHIRSSQSVQVDGWKYIRVGKRDTLYDLKADPGEQRDVAAEHPERVQRLRAQVEAMAAESEAMRETMRENASLPLDADKRLQLEALGYLRSGD